MKERRARDRANRKAAQVARNARLKEMNAWIAKRKSFGDNLQAYYDGLKTLRQAWNDAEQQRKAVYEMMVRETLLEKHMLEKFKLARAEEKRLQAEQNQIAGSIMQESAAEFAKLEAEEKAARAALKQQQQQ